MSRGVVPGGFSVASSVPGLYARMLRYRVAVLIWLFLLLSAAFHGAMPAPGLQLAAAVLALASSYVAATTVNDLADEDIDRVNHPGDRGRPLVTGDASRRDLATVHVVAVVASLGFAALLGWAGVGIVGVGVAIGLAYSARPARLAHRTWLAPVVLSVAYVLVPYALGLVVVGVRPGPPDAVFAGGLTALFLARIVLKDFRDRDGDRRYGRPTLLLRFGKHAVCAVSAAALLLGAALLVAAVRPAPVVAVSLGLLVAAVASQLCALWRAADAHLEQVAIGVGAKMGNGLLIAVLGVLLLRAEGAGLRDQALLAWTITALYGLSFLTLLRRPRQALLAYKG